MVKLDLSTHPPTTIKFTVCYICLFTLRGKKIPGDVHQKFWINLCTTYTGVQIYPSQSYSSDSFSNPASHIVQSSWPLVIISITLQEQIPVSLEIMNCFHFTLVEMLTEWGGGGGGTKHPGSTKNELTSWIICTRKIWCCPLRTKFPLDNISILLTTKWQAYWWFFTKH